MGPQEPPARRCVSLVWALRDARVPPMDYRHKPTTTWVTVGSRWRVNIQSRLTLKDLATQFQVLRYDARGTGMSDWEADEISLDAWVEDLDTVVMPHS